MNPQNTTATAATEVARERVRIFDTTLRDGEQAPGYSMTPAQKRPLAQALVELGVDIIEAGFAAASDGDFASVRRSPAVRGGTRWRLARCQSGDIEAAAAPWKREIATPGSTSSWRPARSTVSTSCA